MGVPEHRRRIGLSVLIRAPAPDKTVIRKSAGVSLTDRHIDKSRAYGMPRCLSMTVEALADDKEIVAYDTRMVGTG